MFKNGVDVAFDHIIKYFNENEKIGLITNPTGINSDLKTTIDLFHESEYVELKYLFALEHGIRGDIPAGKMFDDVIDDLTGLHVYSLYNTNKKISLDALEDIDTIVFDVQEVGVRFYTYLSSLVYAVEMCSLENKRLVILDRPNPLGCKVFGNLLNEEFKSFVGPIAMCTGTGLTIGELALFIKGEYYPNAVVDVVHMENYKRDIHIKDLDTPWISPSPNLAFKRNVDYYPLTCVIEGTNISEGRGTTKPFEVIGAPWFKEMEVIKALKEKNIEGLAYYPVFFKPTASKFKDEDCRGIQVFITDIEKVDYTRFPYELLSVLKSIHSEYDWIPPFKAGRKNFIDYLFGSDKLRLSIDNDEPYSLHGKKFSEEQNDYIGKIKKYYIYK